MNVSKRIVVTVLSLAGALAAGVAQARGPVDVQWSVSIGGPIGVSVYSQPRHVYAPVPVVVHQPRHAPIYAPAYHDRDRDGIPNRYDRVYSPRWDRDGDGIPNRYDRHPNHARHGHHDQDRGRDGAHHGRDNRDHRDNRDNRDNRRGGRD